MLWLDNVLVREDHLKKSNKALTPRNNKGNFRTAALSMWYVDNELNYENVEIEKFNWKTNKYFCENIERDNHIEIKVNIIWSKVLNLIEGTICGEMS
jgi:hypothetical protein